MKYFYKILFYSCLLLVSGSSIAKNKNTYKSLIKQLSVDLTKNQETIIFKWIKATPSKIIREGSRVKIIKPTGETKYYEQFSEFIDDADNLLGSGTGRLATVSEYLNRIQQYYPKVYNKIKNFTPEEQARFMTDFPTENTLSNLTDDAIDVWRKGVTVAGEVFTPVTFRGNTYYTPNASRINFATGTTDFTPLNIAGNPVKAGWNHVVAEHFGRDLANSRSIFDVTEAEIKVLIQQENVLNTTIKEVQPGIYKRTANLNKIVGKTALKFGGKETSWVDIFTDVMGNIITTYPVPSP